MKGLVTFLNTDRNKGELKIALDVIQEFRSKESLEEWGLCPFDCWVKLEQLEDYLKLLTRTDVDSVDDNKAIQYFKEIK